VELGRRDRFEDGFCSLQGSFIPFARTKQERLDTGDPRLSMEERYPTKDRYAISFQLGYSARRREVSGRKAESEGIRLSP